MADKQELQTVEVPEVAAKQAEPEMPTRDQLHDAGWSTQEIESADKQGKIKKDENSPPVKQEKEQVPETKPEEKPKEEPKTQEPKKSGLPDFTFKTPEQEKAWLDAFGPDTPQRGIYIAMKKERQERQRIYNEFVRAQEEANALKKALESVSKNGQASEQEEGEQEEEKPLTLSQLRKMREEEEAQRQKQEQDLHQRASAVSEAQTSQEEYARSVHGDFDDTVAKAQEVIKDLSIVDEPWKQKKILKLFKDLQVSAANADKIGIDDYNAAFIAYEIGQMHPQYGKPSGGLADTNGKEFRPEKAPGGLTPAQLKRIEENTQRRASSASIPGGGGVRRVSTDDVTLTDLNNMDYKKRVDFKIQHPAVYARLVRG